MRVTETVTLPMSGNRMNGQLFAVEVEGGTLYVHTRTDTNADYTSGAGSASSMFFVPSIPTLRISQEAAKTGRASRFKRPTLASSLVAVDSTGEK